MIGGTAGLLRLQMGLKQVVEVIDLLVDQIDLDSEENNCTGEQKYEAKAEDERDFALLLGRRLIRA